MTGSVSKPRALYKGQAVWLRKSTNGYRRGCRGKVVVVRSGGSVVFKVYGKKMTLLVQEQDLSITPIETVPDQRNKKKSGKKPANKKLASVLGLGSIPSAASTKRRSHGRPGVVGGGLPGLGKRR